MTNATKKSARIELQKSFNAKSTHALRSIMRNPSLRSFHSLARAELSRAE